MPILKYLLILVLLLTFLNLIVMMEGLYIWFRMVLVVIGDVLIIFSVLDRKDYHYLKSLIKS